MLIFHLETVRADMMPISKDIGFIGAGHQELFDISVHGDRYLFSAIFNGSFH